MRLIFIREEGDGFTYSCTTHEPILYESKEKAILDFMMAARASFIACEDAEPRKKELVAQEMALREQTSHGHKKTDPERQKKWATEWAKLREEYAKLPEGTFKFLGRTFQHDEFIRRWAGEKQKNEVVESPPEFLTVDEFFAEVENGL